MLRPGRWLAIALRFFCVAAALGATVGTIASISGVALARPRWSELIPPPREWRANWLRVRVGMNREQVVAVIGPPVVVTRDLDPAHQCVDTFGYPDYSNERPTRDLCFDASGRLMRPYASAIKFDLREMADGVSLLEQVPVVALLALLAGVFAGLVAIGSSRPVPPSCTLGFAHGLRTGATERADEPDKARLDT